MPPDAAVLLNTDVVVDERWLEGWSAQPLPTKKLRWRRPGDAALAQRPGRRSTPPATPSSYLGFGFCADYGVEDGPRFAENRDVTVASGSSLLIKREPYADIGGLEPTFWAYAEDQDLAWRARLRGYRTIVAARARCWHKYRFGKTARNHRKFYLLERNRLWFLLRNYQARTLLVVAPAVAVMELGTLADATLHGYLVDKLRAYVDAVLGLPGVRRARRTIQKRRLVSDRTVFAQLAPTVRYPEIDSAALRLANVMLASWYRLARVLV
ncbi:MAG: hypothetical protein U0514_04360 [Candidatus Andersenbacteria bacterium]